MTTRVAARRIRCGILCLPLAGFVYLESLVVAGEYIYPSDDLRGFADQVTSVRFQSSLLVDHLQASLLLVGGIALYAYLFNSRAERWALAGLILLCVSTIVAGMDLGTNLWQIPAAQAYLEGQQSALDAALLGDDPTNYPLLPSVWLIVTGYLFRILSNVFFGIAIWRSRTLPQGAAILWVGATVLGVASLNPSFFLGAWIEALVVALDLGGSGWIAYSVWQQPVARMP